MGDKYNQPFISFGSALKKIREKKSKSTVEVSGAVEIEVSKLISYETGESRPPVDVLMLLIQHFDLDDKEAKELWNLAGYSKRELDQDQYFTNDELGNAREEIVNQINQLEGPIVYTDTIQVMVNNYGVIISFLQGASTTKQPLAVSRVGMSKEHARSVLEVLKQTLEQADKIETTVNKVPKRLPSGKQEEK